MPKHRSDVVVEEKKSNHPVLAYVIGLVFASLSLVVAGGVVYHLAVSHHGPGILRAFFEPVHAPQVPITTGSELQENMARRRHFHNVVDMPRLPDSELPVCMICHTDMPHKKDKKVRSLLNMHTQYLVCESCHIKPPDLDNVRYKWAGPVDPNPQGPFVGTQYEGQTGYLKPVEDTISKITPFYIATGGRREISAVNNQDAEMARAFIRTRDALPQSRHDDIKNKFHQLTEPKGMGCQECHSHEGRLDYRALGFSEKRITDLVYLNVKGMLTKYEVFFLPDLLEASNPNGRSGNEKEQAP